MGIGSVIGKVLGSGLTKAVAPALIGGAFSAYGVRQQNKDAYAAAGRSMDFQREMVDRQEAFQEYSARHRYQWTTQDMRAAGINPMLAYQQGGGSSLTGAGGSGATYQPVNELAGAPDAVNSAFAFRRMNQEITNMKATAAQTRAGTKLTAMQEATERTKQQLNKELMYKAGIERENIVTLNELNKLDLPRKRVEAIIADIDSKHFLTSAGRLGRQAELFSNSAGAVTRALGNLSGLGPRRRPQRRK